MHRLGTIWAFRAVAALTAMALAACAPAVGPYQIRAQQAATACQQGSQAACADYQAVAPAAAAEQQANEAQAQANTGLAIGVIGILAGAAAIAASSDDGGHDHHSHDRDRRHR